MEEYGGLMRGAAGSVRAAGTSTIRRAREDTSFMSEAEALPKDFLGALGRPVDVSLAAGLSAALGLTVPARLGWERTSGPSLKRVGDPPALAALC